MPDEESSTRYQLTVGMLVSVVVLAIAVMMLSAFKVEIPEFISGVILTGFMLMLKDAYSSYFKAREDLQVQRFEEKKACTSLDK